MEYKKMNDMPIFNMVLDFDGVKLYVTPLQFETLDKYIKSKDKLNETIIMFMDLLREGHFEDALEETKKDGEAKVNRYNNGLYDVLNMVENWWRQHYSDKGSEREGHYGV